MADGDGVLIEDLYEIAGIPGLGFFQRITIPPNTCTETVEYSKSYVVYPLTGGQLEIEINGKVSIENLRAGEFYARVASKHESMKVRVCNNDKYEPIVVLKG